MEDDSGSYSLELTLHLHPTYVLLCSRVHFNFFLHTSVEGEKKRRKKKLIAFSPIHSNSYPGQLLKQV